MWAARSATPCSRDALHRYGPVSSAHSRFAQKPAPSRLNSAKPGHIRVLVDAEVCIAMSEPWLSADDISAHLGVTKDTVYAWIADKAMPAHKVGRLWKFQASEVDNWVRSGGAETPDEATSPP